ncbi:ATP-binding cassette domain-containing protein [Arcanobacterium hippocoleae]
MNILNVQKVSKLYGSFSALTDVSFSVNSGSITALLGPNGAGKSSLMRIICGLSQPSNGQITVDSKTIADINPPVKEIGALLNPDWLDKRLTCENILKIQTSLLGIKSSQSAIKEILFSVGLEQAAKTRVKNLSLGMRQRLALAAATLGEPKLLILDEPMNGLDPQGIRWLRDKLRDYCNNGGSILISSHIISEVSLIATDLIVLSKGKIRFSGSINEIRPITAHATRFTTANPDMLNLLLQALAQKYPEAQFISGDGFTVGNGIKPENVSAAALQEKVILTELIAMNPSLEDTYFQLVEE